MSDPIAFDTQFQVEADRCVRLTPLVRRIVAGNASAFTFTGTCSYIVGNGTVAVIDPGPDNPRHTEALLEAVRGETVSHILVSHTHRDHSPGARALKDATGAMIVGCGPHTPARPLGMDETNPLEASGDLAFFPEWRMSDGDTVQGPGWSLAAVETPGHTMNHLCFALPEETALFSADHVMAWSTSIVAPPDGSMAAYLESLEKLRGRPETVFWPGHGGPVSDPQRFVRALIHHRRQREASILNRLDAGDRTIPQIVGSIYQGLKPALMGAAGLSVFAHLEDLVARGDVLTDGDPTIDADYRRR
jgi:glyoxylase-like metal-dependent hydrolase (beta-lactamase superfamily II)